MRVPLRSKTRSLRVGSESDLDGIAVNSRYDGDGVGGGGGVTERERGGCGERSRWWSRDGGDMKGGGEYGCGEEEGGGSEG